MIILKRVQGVFEKTAYERYDVYVDENLFRGREYRISMFEIENPDWHNDYEFIKSSYDYPSFEDLYKAGYSFHILKHFNKVIKSELDKAKFIQTIDFKYDGIIDDHKDG